MSAPVVLNVGQGQGNSGKMSSRTKIMLVVCLICCCCLIVSSLVGGAGAMFSYWTESDSPSPVGHAINNEFSWKCENGGKLNAAKIRSGAHIDSLQVFCDDNSSSPIFGNQTAGKRIDFANGTNNMGVNKTPSSDANPAVNSLIFRWGGQDYGTKAGDHNPDHTLQCDSGPIIGIKGYHHSGDNARVRQLGPICGTMAFF